MKFFRKTVFWVFVLFLLGGAFYLYDMRSEGTKEEAEAEKRLAPFDAKEVFSISIHKKGAPPVVVVREGDGWVLDSPISAQGDAEEIDRYVGRITGAKYDGVLFEKAAKENLDEMGLSDPVLTVVIATGNGAKKTLYFGDVGPTHNVSFASVKDDPRVFRINTDIKSDADRDAYQMRDKRLVSFDPTRAKRMEIRWTGGEKISLEQRAEGKWNTTGVADGRTDFMRLMETIVKLRASKIKAFVEEEKKDLEKYGLRTPRAVVSFIDADGAKHSISVGSRDKESRGYYAVADNTGVVLLEEDLVDSIPRSAADLEDKGGNGASAN